MYHLPKSIAMTTRSRTCWSIALALTCLMTRNEAADAQEPGITDAVAILNAAMGFRVAVLHDSTQLETCSALAVLGRPADFPQKLNAYVLKLLDRNAIVCDQPRVPQANMSCPLVRLQKLTIADSTATLDLMVTRGESLHREIYTLMRYPRVGWGFRSVTLSGYLEVLWGVNPGDRGRDGPVCPRGG
jgi:hypothetical protein